MFSASILWLIGIIIACSIVIYIFMNYVLSIYLDKKIIRNIAETKRKFVKIYFAVVFLIIFFIAFFNLYKVTKQQLDLRDREMERDIQTLEVPTDNEIQKSNRELEEKKEELKEKKIEEERARSREEYNKILDGE